ncbi:hypothetical protein QBC34DRAFT_454662 [Podospora aff. communis PSN243]|uniref:Glycoside Hydrolase Family 93 n=1 Tax=Podospora aff. communis PSN243 TaxID=3040156 RepID=A0AAV9G4U9_9PEZI|nr:hypothetical protein QBC34DRAFT_454662 [Podospora aff. communis PSN243]
MHTLFGVLLATVALLPHSTTGDLFPVQGSHVPNRIGDAFYYHQSTINYWDPSPEKSGLLAAYKPFKATADVETWTSPLIIKFSPDGGNNWQDRHLVDKSVGEMFNPSMVQLPDGRILLAFLRSNWEAPLNNKASKYSGISIWESADGGTTWPVKHVAQELHSTDAELADPFLRHDSSGDTQLYYSERSFLVRGDSRIKMKRRSSGSADWGDPVDVARAVGYSPPTVAAFKKAGVESLVCAFQSFVDDTPTGSPRSIINTTISTDHGLSWTSLRVLQGVIPDGRNINDPYIASVGKHLVITYSAVDPYQEHQVYILEMLVSSDGGATWSPTTPKELVKWASGGSVLDVSSQGSEEMLIVFGKDWTDNGKPGVPYIMQVRTNKFHPLINKVTTDSDIKDLTEANTNSDVTNVTDLDGGTDNGGDDLHYYCFNSGTNHLLGSYGDDFFRSLDHNVFDELDNINFYFFVNFLNNKFFNQFDHLFDQLDNEFFNCDPHFIDYMYTRRPGRGDGHRHGIRALDNRGNIYRHSHGSD